LSTPTFDWRVVSAAITASVFDWRARGPENRARRILDQCRAEGQAEWPCSTREASREVADPEWIPPSRFRGLNGLSERACATPPHVLHLGSVWKSRRRNMSRKCEVCGKRPQVGNNVSHAHNVTKRRWLPNLQRVKIVKNGTPQKILVCTRCIRSGAIDQYRKKAA